MAFDSKVLNVNGINITLSSSKPEREEELTFTLTPDERCDVPLSVNIDLFRTDIDDLIEYLTAVVAQYDEYLLEKDIEDIDTADDNEIVEVEEEE